MSLPIISLLFIPSFVKISLIRYHDDFQGQLFFSHGKTNSRGVAIGYYGKKSFELLSKFNDKSGRVLILEVKIENEVLLLINLYNANTENEQLSTLSDLSNMLEKIDDINNKSIVFGGDFNLFFEAKLEEQGGYLVLKKKSLAKLIQIKEKFDLCDIWRIRNPNTKRYTFRQQHSSGYIQRRLDYFFISNVLQESVKNPDVLAAFSTDHSPMMFSVFSKSEGKRGKDLWKHNNSLCEESLYIDSIKNISYLP